MVGALVTLIEFAAEEPFVLHSGGLSDWRINADSLTDDQLASLARWYATSFGKPYGFVLGIPRGGLRFARALRAYTTPGSQRLLVADDVCTTGESLAGYHYGDPDCIGVVIFARGPVPNWVTPLFAVAGAPQ